MNNKTINYIRFFARIISSFILILIMILFLGEDYNNLHIKDLTQREILLFIFLFTMIAGLLIAYKKELIGGIITLISFIIFIIINQKANIGLVFSLFLIASVSYIICGYFDLKNSKK